MRGKKRFQRSGKRASTLLCALALAPRELLLAGSHTLINPDCFGAGGGCRDEAPTFRSTHTLEQELQSELN
jgi:hypothetical protein